MVHKHIPGGGLEGGKWRRTWDAEQSFYVPPTMLPRLSQYCFGLHTKTVSEEVSCVSEPLQRNISTAVVVPAKLPEAPERLSAVSKNSSHMMRTLRMT